MLMTEYAATMREVVGEDFAKSESEQQGAYYAHLVDHYERLKVLPWLKGIAAPLDPIDSVLGQDPAAPVAASFVAGGLLGMACAETYFQPNGIREMISNKDLYPPLFFERDDNPREQAFRFGALFTSLGQEAYDKVPDLHALVDHYTYTAPIDLAYSTHLTNGFGFIVYLADRKHELETALSDIPDTADEWDGMLSLVIPEMFEGEQ